MSIIATLAMWVAIEIGLAVAIIVLAMGVENLVKYAIARIAQRQES